MTQNDTNTAGKRFEIWCQNEHRTIVEPIDWPNDDTPPYNCPVCAGAVRYEEQIEEGPPYHVQYSVWEKGDSAYTDNGPTRRDSHTGERETFEGVFNEETPLECVNAILYDMRGSKSHYELAYVDEITPLAEKKRDASDL